MAFCFFDMTIRIIIRMIISMNSTIIVIIVGTSSSRVSSSVLGLRRDRNVKAPAFAGLDSSSLFAAGQGADALVAA
jgi:hypothetical protein